MRCGDRAILEETLAPGAARAGAGTPYLAAEPEQRLADGVVADDLGHPRVEVEAAPHRDPGWLPVGQRGEQQAGLAHRKIVPGSSPASAPGPCDV